MNYINNNTKAENIIDLKWNGDNMNEKKKIRKTIALFLPAVSIALSSCNTNNSPVSIPTDTSSTSPSSSSINNSSTKNMWTEAKVVSKPNKTEVVGLQNNYKVGDIMEFTINNMTGFDLIVKINKTQIEPDQHYVYKYKVLETDTTLSIYISENIIKIKPVFNYSPVEYSNYIKIKFVNKDENDIKPGDELTIQINKTNGYSLKAFSINGTSMLLRINNDYLTYRVPDDETQLVFDIEVGYDQKTIQTKITSKEGDNNRNFTITGFKQLYQANQKAEFTIIPFDYYKIDYIKVNGSQLKPIEEINEIKKYSFVVPSGLSTLEVYVHDIPKTPIIKGDISIDDSGIPRVLEKIPGMYVQVIDDTDGKYKTDPIFVDFTSTTSRYISQVNANNGEYYTNHSYTIKLYIPDGNNGYKEVYSTSGIKLSYEGLFIRPIILDKSVDLTFTGEYDLPYLPITMTNGTFNKDVDKGNVVMLSSSKKNMTVTLNLQYTGKIVNDDQTVIKDFKNKYSTDEYDFEYSFILNDYKYNKSNYYFKLLHSKKDGNYYVTHNLDSSQTPLIPITNNNFIRALSTGKLKIEINRNIIDGSYHFNTYLKIDGDDSDSGKLKLDEFTRSASTNPVTYIGSKMEFKTLFNDDINKGDFVINNYHISCDDNV